MPLVRIKPSDRKVLLSEREAVLVMRRLLGELHDTSGIEPGDARWQPFVEMGRALTGYVQAMPCLVCGHEPESDGHAVCTGCGAVRSAS